MDLASFNAGSATATGTNVTLNAGTNGGLVVYQNRIYGRVNTNNLMGTAQFGYFYCYTTALPSDLTISPSLIEGWAPGATYTFTPPT